MVAWTVISTCKKQVGSDCQSGKNKGKKNNRYLKPPISCLCGRRQSALGTLALSAQASDGTLVASHVLATILSLEVLHAEIHHSVVEVFTTQMGVTSSGLHLKDSILNCQQRHIESASTHVVDQHISLPSALLVKTISDGSGSRLVDDAQHVHAWNGACIFGGLTLRIVEVSRHGDHCVINLGTQVRLSRLLHLQQNHGRDLFRVELFLLRSCRRFHVQTSNMDFFYHGTVSSDFTDDDNLFVL